MVFDYFRKRQQTKAIEQCCDAFVKFQFLIGSEEPANHTDDAWVLGYVFGASTAVLQRMGIEPGREGYELLKSGYSVIYENAVLAQHVLDNSLTLTKNPTFAEAQLVGGSEITAASPGGPAPFGLGRFLGTNKSVESRMELRQRAEDRMGAEVFRSTLNSLVAGRT